MGLARVAAQRRKRAAASERCHWALRLMAAPTGHGDAVMRCDGREELGSRDGIAGRFVQVRDGAGGLNLIDGRAGAERRRRRDLQNGNERVSVYVN